MWKRLNASVAEIWRARPGDRFQARYRRWRNEREESLMVTLVYITVGVITIVAGIVFSFSPLIPGFVFIIAGLAMLAARFEPIARGLDRGEMTLRNLLASYRGRKHRRKIRRRFHLR